MIRLDQLFNSVERSRLDELVEHAQNVGELTQILQSGLPSDLAGQLLAANLREDGELVLICSSQAMAARLRYETANLTKAAIESGRDVKKCRVCVSRDISRGP